MNDVCSHTPHTHHTHTTHKPHTHTTPQIIPIAWVNMNIFDYSKKLQTGQFVLYAWPVEDELEESVNFMGSSVLNSSTSETVPVLEVEVRAPNVQRGKAIVYPLHERIEHVAREASKGMISPVSVCVCVCVWGVMCHCGV